ncbi:MAG TPA: nucleotidyltransferase family protein [archaeon]|nr:nucleotidyltransferase family protein [archaeon]
MGKERISITLEGGLLKRVDRLVGELADNRSNVVEVLLEEGLMHRMPKSAVVLVGGGKEAIMMQTFEDKTLIEHHVETLASVGVENIFVVGGDIDKLRTYLESKGVKARFLKDNNEGSAGCLRSVKDLVKNTFFIIYGDMVTGADLVDMYQFHTRHEAIATMGLTTTDKPGKFGVLEMKGSKVVGFAEKPERTKSFLVNAGVFVVEPEIIDMIPKGKSSMETAVVPKLIEAGKLYGYTFGGFWKDFGEE